MKKKMNRMMDGGMAMPVRNRMAPPMGGNMAMPVRGGGGIPVQGPSGSVVPVERPDIKGGRGMMRDRMMGLMNRPRGKSMAPIANRTGMKGGGLARKGVGQALKSGGMVKACGVAKRGKTKGKIV